MLWKTMVYNHAIRRTNYMAYGKISVKQSEILQFVKEEILKKGYPPSVREICEAVDLKSTSSVHAHLETLEKNGYIKRDPTKPRTIEIMDGSFQMLRHKVSVIPIIKSAPADRPILDEQNIDGYFPIQSDSLPEEEAFAIKVKDNSMVNAGINKGDLVLVKSVSTASKGDTVVARIKGTPTVRTYYKENGHFRLQPENDTMEPVILDEVEILGKVFGIFRLYR
jgi:repressor LexA